MGHSCDKSTRSSSQAVKLSSRLVSCYNSPMSRMRPSFIIIACFFLLILCGGLLLSLPICSSSGTATNILDAVFISNSSTCDTALSTLDIGKHFSLVGIIVIMILIQIGGLAVITLSSFMALVFRQKLYISQNLVSKDALNFHSSKDIFSVIKKIFTFVFIIEAIGAIVLFIRWMPELGNQKALLYAIFHSISAFNNAGFALTSNFSSLQQYAGDITINLTITSLIIIGGIGFMVIADLISRKRLSIHSKIVILMTVILLFFGTLLILILEFNNPNTLGSMDIPHKIMTAFFQAVAPRTAGFSTINYSQIFPATALLTMLLMFIGANPGGTGGGIKTTTFALIISTIWATLTGNRNTIMFNRRVPPDITRRSFAIIFLSLAFLAAAIITLGSFEHFSLMELSFETFSAFSSVGLSLGITPYLSKIGKIVIMIVMFIGRVGPLALILALTIGQKEPKIKPPKEGISIG